MKGARKSILRASLSLDGRLLNASGRPLNKSLSDLPLDSAEELHLRIQPIIAGGESSRAAPLSAGGFLEEDVRFQLFSVSRQGKALALRYRRTR